MFAIITVLRAATILVTMVNKKILATIPATEVANLASCV